MLKQYLPLFNWKCFGLNLGTLLLIVWSLQPIIRKHVIFTFDLTLT